MLITRTQARTRRESALRSGKPRVSVVVPTLNEAKNLPHVFAKLPADIHEVILVDGRSVDDTIEVAQRLRPDIVVVRQTRKGKGNALACGFAAVTGDIVVMLDADGSADPGEIPAFVDALMSGADFAKGTRFARGGGSTDITRLRRAGNWGLNALVNVLYRTRYTDLCYGYNAFWVTCLDILELAPGEKGSEMLWGDGFEIETIINTRVARAGLAIAEVGSFEHERLHGTSNLNTFKDGARVLRAISLERRNRRARERTLVATPLPLDVPAAVHEPAAEPVRAAESKPAARVVLDVDTEVIAS
ncbi:MAG: glycosyltransferase family 2 protein [Kineosporiaceae bacterium]